MGETTARPTGEFARRHMVQPPVIDREHRRPFWFVSSRFARLHGRGLLGGDAFEAACRWREDYERAHGLPPPALERVPGSAGWDRDVSDAVIDAQARLSRALDAVGPYGWVLLIAVVIEDTSWRVLAKRYGERTAAVQDRFVATAERLEPVYARQRRPA